MMLMTGGSDFGICTGMQNFVISVPCWEIRYNYLFPLNLSLNYSSAMYAGSVTYTCMYCFIFAPSAPLWIHPRC